MTWIGPIPLVRLLTGALFVLIAAAPAACSEPVSLAALQNEYVTGIHPLLKGYCLECHSAETKEGQLDLERFGEFAAVRTDPLAWQKVSEMLHNGEMPPKESKQLTPAERKLLMDWVRHYLDAEARASAGDPGPVVLRRLTNAEYTYSIQDLTRVPLTPAQQFPVDGAAGEGFSNTGNALVMSPALFAKYLEAAKDVASHAVLLPAGIRFSEGNTRRNVTNELLSEIRQLYLRHTTGAADLSRLNRWTVSNPLQATDEDGRVDLTRYFTTLLIQRQRLLANRSQVAAVAAEAQLNAKYLQLLFEMLANDQPQSLLLESLRERYRTATPAEAPALVAQIRAWQSQLWKFNTVAHFGDTRPWQQAVTPLPETVALRQAIDPKTTEEVLTFYLLASNLGGAAPQGAVHWQRPRFEFKDRPMILLRDLRPLSAQIERNVATELSRAEEYLAAAAQLPAGKQTLEALAAESKLDPKLLQHWAQYLGLDRPSALQLTGHLTNKMTKVAGHEAVSAWGVSETPSITANSSDKPISFSTLTIPAHGVVLHPSPEQQACIAWRSPLDGRVHLSGKIADADRTCGNGISWSCEHRSASGVRVLASGTIDNGGKRELTITEEVEVVKGDVLLISIGPRDANHSCDTTHLELKLTSGLLEELEWDLSADVSPDILAGNPHADQQGNKDIWHFLASGTKAAGQPAVQPVPDGSALAHWRAAVNKAAPAEELAQLAKAVQAALRAAPESLGEADLAMVRALKSWEGPLHWATEVKFVPGEIPAQAAADAKTFGLDPALFEKAGEAKSIAGESLTRTAPEILEIKVPASLVRGGEFVVEGALAPGSAAEAAVQLQLLTQQPAAESKPSASVPILTRADSSARAALEQAFEDFRNLFPAAMCYARIVPVDEVVTLVLFHREDEPLARLMLSAEEIARLDHLWDELHYVSQDALASVTACEQLIEFATQDRGDLVPIFKSMQPPIIERAKVFSQRLIDTQPAHLSAVLALAGQAYRRPLAEKEQAELRGLYAALRAQQMPHEEALRLTIARVLAAPAFLYKLEQPGPGKAAVPVSDGELASRLSYFLWSSLPDEELRAAVAARTLQQDEVLLAHTRRMLRAGNSRRLAIEFACQWLHIREFDQHNEKSEQHFPEFAGLRSEMYEESIQFFTDLIQNDGSLLDVIRADHTFLNVRLAKYYGVPNVLGDQWRKVANVRQYQRGGVLTQATVLATQSGASRTSPILRGNWVSETLLGERLPRPPKNVPQLPENVPTGLTERQLIEKHSSDASCAKCHAKIDPYGFSLEQFDAIGRLRERDAEKQPLDVAATLPDGTKIVGVAGLQEYLATQRRADVLRQMCRKLLGYALGRSVQLSDEPLLDKMLADLAAQEYRFSVAVEAIVLSEQFRRIRGQQFVGAEQATDPAE